MNNNLNSGMKLIRKLVLSSFILLSVIIPVYAGSNDCELLAKQYQKAYGGDLIFIQPLKDNGAFDLGTYNGHWMNKAYSKVQGIYYHDPTYDNHFETIDQARRWFEYAWNRKAVAYNYNQERIPFALRFYY